MAKESPSSVNVLAGMTGPLEYVAGFMNFRIVQFYFQVDMTKFRGSPRAERDPLRKNISGASLIVLGRGKGDQRLAEQSDVCSQRQCDLTQPQQTCYRRLKGIQRNHVRTIAR